MAILTIFIQHNIESPNQGNYARKRNKRHIKWKGSKADRILYIENPKDSTKLFFYECRKAASFYSSVQFSCSVMSSSFRPYGLQHTRLPCPSPTPGACSNSCPSSQRCHPTISSSVIPFSCLQSFPASESFPTSQFFTLGNQCTRASALASVLPINIQG